MQILTDKYGPFRPATVLHSPIYLDFLKLTVPTSPFLIQLLRFSFADKEDPITVLLELAVEDILAALQLD